MARAAPINPLDIVRSEHPLLRAGGRNLKNRYEGKLKYDRAKNRFLVFYNSKYDVVPGVHKLRARFSIGHELGHYFIESHRTLLIRPGGSVHESRSEFTANNPIERDADHFAATLLLPTPLVRPRVNQQELTVQRIGEMCDMFQTSLVNTPIRAVRLSQFPCAVVESAKAPWPRCSSPSA